MKKYRKIKIVCLKTNTFEAFGIDLGLSEIQKSFERGRNFILCVY